MFIKGQSSILDLVDFWVKLARPIWPFPTDNFTVKFY